MPDKLDWKKRLTRALATSVEKAGNNGSGGGARRLANGSNHLLVTSRNTSVTAMKAVVTNPATVTVGNQQGAALLAIDGYPKTLENRRFMPTLTAATTVTIDAEHDAAERAAIAEFDGGIPRKWADGIARLEPRPVAGFSEGRWLQILNDAGRFLDAWGAEAAKLSWSLTDLFGYSRVPCNSYSPAGLIFVIGGGQVTAINNTCATIWKCGSYLTYHRPSPPLVSIWDLKAANE